MKKTTLLLLVFLSVTLGAKADVVTKEAITTNVDISTNYSKDDPTTYTPPYTMTVTEAWNGISCYFSPAVSATKLVVKLSEAKELKVIAGTSSGWDDIAFVETGTTATYTLDWSATKGAQAVYQIHIQGRVTGDFTLTDAYFILADGTTKQNIPLSSFTTDNAEKATYTLDYYSLTTTDGWKGVTFTKISANATKATVTLQESAKFKVYIGYAGGSSLEAFPETASAEVLLDPSKTVSSINIQTQEAGTIKLKSIKLDNTVSDFNLSQDMTAFGGGSYNKATKTITTTTTWEGVQIEGLSLYSSGVTIKECTSEGAVPIHMYVKYKDVADEQEVNTSTDARTVHGTLDHTKKIEKLTFKLETKTSATLDYVKFDAVCLSSSTTGVPDATPDMTYFYKPLKAGWNSFCVPFEMPLTDIAADAKAYTFTSYDGTSTATFTKVEGETLSAGVPYLLKLSEATTIAKLYEGKEISSTITNSDASNNMTFKGNYNAEMDMEDKYGVTSNKIMQGAAGSKLNAFAAYFEISEGGARELSISTDDEVTAIKTVHASRLLPTECYDLQGRKVALPTRGLYIVNGKKIIIK